MPRYTPEVGEKLQKIISSCATTEVFMLTAGKLWCLYNRTFPCCNQNEVNMSIITEVQQFHRIPTPKTKQI